MDRHGAAAPPRPAKLPGRATRLLPPPPAQRPLVTLSQPRPDSERTLNAYVETPPRSQHQHQHQQQQQQHQHQHQQQQIRPTKRSEPEPERERRRPAVLTQQPTGGGGGGGGKRVAPECPRDSIICAQCGRCRCAQCARPRPLPSRWLGDSCFCSAETAIDYASCMCCAKALFYHCCDGEDDADECLADAPCSCTGERRAVRWACLAALAVALPCLLCYWPLRGVAKLSQDAYARAHRSGCRCKRR